MEDEKLPKPSGKRKLTKISTEFNLIYWNHKIHNLLQEAEEPAIFSPHITLLATENKKYISIDDICIVLDGKYKAIRKRETLE